MGAWGSERRFDKVFVLGVGVLIIIECSFLVFSTIFVIVLSDENGPRCPETTPRITEGRCEGC